MFQGFALGTFCYVIWLLLSGFFTNILLLTLGLLSSLLVVLITWRMEIADPEEGPLRIDISPEIIWYWLWLVGQIVLSSWNVTRLILQRDMAISPTMISFHATQQTDLGRVIYANSITLTPGTVTTSLLGDKLDIHALTQEIAQEVLAGEMDRRVTHLENTNVDNNADDEDGISEGASSNDPTDYKAHRDNTHVNTHTENANTANTYNTQTENITHKNTDNH